jgi:dTMP kinase
VRARAALSACAARLRALPYASPPFSLTARHATRPATRSAALLAALSAGQNVVMDRYAFSGVAFSAAKPGMEVGWCAAPDAGLPMPDVLLFMDLPADKAAARGGFGEERYEKPAFQAAVRGAFDELKARMAVAGGAAWWCTVDAAGSIDEVSERVAAAVADPIARAHAGQAPLRTLWDGAPL